jgi:hypothetical protein
MRVFLVKAFARFRRREGISDPMLSDAVARAEGGLIDVELGGGLIKQRVARRGQGKSAGFRTLIAYRNRERAVFLYGFAKSERDNVRPDQLAELKLYAGHWLELDDLKIERALREGDLQEVVCDQAADKA